MVHFQWKVFEIFWCDETANNGPMMIIAKANINDMLYQLEERSCTCGDKGNIPFNVVTEVYNSNYRSSMCRAVNVYKHYTSNSILTLQCNQDERQHPILQ